MLRKSLKKEKIQVRHLLRKKIHVYVDPPNVSCTFSLLKDMSFSNGRS